MRRKVKQLLAAGMALAVLATNLTPLSFAAEQADAAPAAAASVETYDARAKRDWKYTGCSWSSDNKTVTFNYRNKNGTTKSVTVNSTESKKSPTCTKDGEIRYKATVYSTGHNSAPDGEVRGVEKTVTVPKLNHNFPATPEKIVFENLDNLGNKPTAKATYRCTRCNETKTETVTDLTYVVVKEATCTENGEGYWVAKAGSKTVKSAHVHPRKTEHDFTKTDAAHVTFVFAEDGKTAVATIQCDHCDATTKENVTCTAEVTTPATCTEKGTTTYTATCGTASATTTRQDVPALGHSFTNYVYDGNGSCTADGTATAKCDRCDAANTLTASNTAHCALHLVDGAQVCPVCGKVDGRAALNAVSADFDATPDTVGLRLVVRVGSLPSGKRILTVVFVDDKDCMVPVSGTYKVHVSLADVKAQLGESDAADFTHTLTLLNAADGAKTDVGYALENGTLIFDARFDGRACLLQID